MDNLYDKIMNYIQATKNDQVEFKPSEHQVDLKQKLSRINIDAELQTIKKDYSNKIDHQIYNICENIVFTFFSLTNEKFYAIIQRSKYWGLESCIEEFILHYYLFLKQNNRLRMFVLLHFNKIILTVCSVIEAQLIEKMNLQDFSSSKKEITNLTSKLMKKEEELKDIAPVEQKKQITEPIKNIEDSTKLKESILADLKLKNKELEEI